MANCSDLDLIFNSLFSGFMSHILFAEMNWRGEFVGHAKGRFSSCVWLRSIFLKKTVRIESCFTPHEAFKVRAEGPVPYSFQCRLNNAE